MHTVIALGDVGGSRVRSMYARLGCGCGCGGSCGGARGVGDLAPYVDPNYNPATDVQQTAQQRLDQLSTATQGTTPGTTVDETGAQQTPSQPFYCGLSASLPGCSGAGGPSLTTLLYVVAAAVGLLAVASVVRR